METNQIVLIVVIDLLCILYLFYSHSKVQNMSKIDETPLALGMILVLFMCYLGNLHIIESAKNKNMKQYHEKIEKRSN